MARLLRPYYHLSYHFWVIRSKSLDEKLDLCHDQYLRRKRDLFADICQLRVEDRMKACRKAGVEALVTGSGQ